MSNVESDFFDERLATDGNADFFFDCREIVYCSFEYSDIEFSRLDRRAAASFWQEQLEATGLAKPLLLGSPFDDADGSMALDVNTADEVNVGLMNVVIYYFYEEASYSISGDVDETGVVNCDPVLSSLEIEQAMDSISMGGRAFYFECDSSIVKSEVFLSIFERGKNVYRGTLSRFLELKDN